MAIGVICIFFYVVYLCVCSFFFFLCLHVFIGKHGAALLSVTWPGRKNEKRLRMEQSPHLELVLGEALEEWFSPLAPFALGRVLAWPSPILAQPFVCQFLPPYQIWFYSVLFQIIIVQTVRVPTALYSFFPTFHWVGKNNNFAGGHISSSMATGGKYLSNFHHHTMFQK